MSLVGCLELSEALGIDSVYAGAEFSLSLDFASPDELFSPRLPKIWTFDLIRETHHQDSSLPQKEML